MELYFTKDIKLTNKIFLFCFFSIFSIFQGQVVSTASPSAMKATTGVGLHKSRVYWINWDTNNDGNPSDNLLTGAVSTFTSPAGFVYTITISNVKVYNSSGTELTSGVDYIFNSAKTTSYFMNNFPSGYAGFPGGKDVIGLSNVNAAKGDGNRVTFTLTVVAKDPYGNSGNATGIVIGGSESLAGNYEWYTLKMNTGRVRLIDKYIRNNVWTNFETQLQISNAGKTIKTTNQGTNGDGRGDVMLFAEDVASIDCEVKGGGGQSFAVGFLEELDYSDAPASYGLAYHLVENKFSGGLFPDGNTNVNTLSNAADLASGSGQLAKFADPNLRLGTDIDSEDVPTLPAAGTAPNVDDLSGADDEGALPNTPANINGYVGIPYVNISPFTSYLTMWIDVNRNGVFESTEKVTNTIPPNKSGTKVMDLTSLAIPVGTNYYTRVRYSSQNNLLPTGYAPDGEVEDHFINIVNNTYNIMGTVFLDNNSGTPDGTALYNITVELYNSLGTLVATTSTSFDGEYIFSNLSNGNYTVKVVSPVSPSYQNVSSTDATPLDGSTAVVVNNANILAVKFGLYFNLCYKPSPTTTGGLPTNHGITALGRAGAENGNWPMVRTGAWTALEAKTKGFVINRVVANYEPPLDDGQVPTITNPTKGMVIYDTTNKCLKIYDGTTWKCFSVQGCPAIN